MQVGIAGRVSVEEYSSFSFSATCRYFFPKQVATISIPARSSRGALRGACGPAQPGYGVESACLHHLSAMKTLPQR